jgi:hypothetical protein
VDEDHAQYMLELDRMMHELGNHPSIVVWTPFNEAWGQHRTLEVGKWTAERDPARLVNVASGGNFWPVGDIVDEHRYPHPGFAFDAERDRDFIKVVGEFGGHGLVVTNHLWNPNRNNWGYGGLPKDAAEYRERYTESIRQLAQLKAQGIAAGVYTQTTDVEGEVNGLLTYDREVAKIPAKELSSIHEVLFGTAELRAELIQMREDDQKHRLVMHELTSEGVMDATHPKFSQFEQAVQAQQEIDKRTIARLEQILGEHGWPGIRWVGNEAATAAFLVIQHADLSYQERYLPMMKNAVRSGELAAGQFAMLEDRVLMRQGKKQIYGTQLHSSPESPGKLLVYPIEDPDHVDERRQSVGLPPMAEYLKRFGTGE